MGPEICFRIVHSAVHSENCALLEAYREQEVEVALGTMGVLEDCDVGTLRRRIEADQVVSVVPLTRDNLKQPTVPKTPHITELLRKAIGWRHQLDAGEVRNQADIARRERITRARVTQVMALLRLAPETRERILAVQESTHRQAISERALRPIAQMTPEATRLTNRSREGDRGRSEDRKRSGVRSRSVD